MARPPKKLKITEIENWEFYWSPRKKYYDEGDLRLFGSEYIFVVPGTRSPITISVNTKEPFDEYDFDSLDDDFSTNYFFRVDEVPDKARQKLIVAIFDLPSVIIEYIKVNT